MLSPRLRTIGWTFVSSSRRHATDVNSLHVSRRARDPDPAYRQELVRGPHRQQEGDPARVLRGGARRPRGQRRLKLRSVYYLVPRENSSPLICAGMSTLLPKPAAAPAAHSILKNGAVAASSYVPVYEKQKPMVLGGPGSASPYSTLSRPGSSMSNGKPEPTP